MNHQRQPSVIENAILSAIDPKSTAVYYLANAGIIVLIIALIALYLILESGHLLVMMFLALGLLGSVNFVWMNRGDPDEDTKNTKQQTARKRKRTKKKRKE
eukprot:356789_1